MEASSRRSFRELACIAMIVSACPIALAQAPNYAGVGRTPTADEIRKWDIAVGPSGAELPTGRGTALEGVVVYAMKRCNVCHGSALEGTQYGPRLVGSSTTATASRPARTIGNYWPFATTLWDYINRAMPRSPFQEGSLTPNEVYALTALILYKNEVIAMADVVDRDSLPKIRMPNRAGFFPDIPDWPWYQRSCRLGLCRP